MRSRASTVMLPANLGMILRHAGIPSRIAHRAREPATRVFSPGIWGFSAVSSVRPGIISWDQGRSRDAAYAGAPPSNRRLILGHLVSTPADHARVPGTSVHFDRGHATLPASVGRARFHPWFFLRFLGRFRGIGMSLDGGSSHPALDGVFRLWLKPDRPGFFGSRIPSHGVSGISKPFSEISSQIRAPRHTAGIVPSIHPPAGLESSFKASASSRA